VTAWNENARPFIWTKTAEHILESLSDFFNELTAGDTRMFPTAEHKVALPHEMGCGIRWFVDLSLGHFARLVFHRVPGVSRTLDARHKAAVGCGQQSLGLLKEDDVMANPVCDAAAAGAHDCVRGLPSSVVEHAEATVEIDSGNRRARKVTIGLREELPGQRKVSWSINRLSSLRWRHHACSTCPARTRSGPASTSRMNALRSAAWNSSGRIQTTLI